MTQLEKRSKANQKRFETEKDIERLEASRCNPFRRYGETHEQQVTLCDMWLDIFTEEATTWTRSTSYGFKHEVERYFRTYVSNDAFIESARKRYEAKQSDVPINYVFKFKANKDKKLYDKYRTGCRY